MLHRQGPTGGGHGNCASRGSLQGQVMRAGIASQLRAGPKPLAPEATTPDSPNSSLDVRGSRWLGRFPPSFPRFSNTGACLGLTSVSVARRQHCAGAPCSPPGACQLIAPVAASAQSTAVLTSRSVLSSVVAVPKVRRLVARRDMDASMRALLRASKSSIVCLGDRA